MALAPARLRSIIGGSAGNLVEWYDFYAYSALTLYFAPLFFPGRDATTQLADAAAISAIGFLMRPVGAWIMGVYGDRRGRKAGLALSVSLMCLGSLLIAVAPTAARAGPVLAPAVLLAARLMQGLSVGGEYGTSATYLSEMATRERRGYYSSYQYVTLVGGQLAALASVILLQRTLPKAAITDWGWRIPFVVGAVLALAVYFLRRRLAETPTFEAMAPAERSTSSVAALWRDNRRAFLLIVAMTAGGSLAFYAFTTYLQKFLVNSAGWSKESASEVCAAALFLFMCAQPVWGAVSDRIGRRPVLLVFGIGGMLATVPVFHALKGATGWGEALALMMIPLLLTGAYTAVSAVVKAELFPPHIRTLGVALPYAIGNTAFGGTAEYVALWFKQRGVESGFFWYVSAMIGVALMAFLLLPETKGRGEG